MYVEDIFLVFITQIVVQGKNMFCFKCYILMLSLLLKEFCDFCHRPLGNLLYFSPYIFGIIEKLLFPRRAFLGLNFTTH
jgi:hypothetical protein